MTSRSPKGVVGDGPIDLVYVPGYVSDVEMMWECPQAAAFMERLASYAEYGFETSSRSLAAVKEGRPP